MRREQIARRVPAVHVRRSKRTLLRAGVVDVVPERGGADVAGRRRSHSAPAAVLWDGSATEFYVGILSATKNKHFLGLAALKLKTLERR